MSQTADELIGFVVTQGRCLFLVHNVYCDKVNYLGVYFERNSGHSDISQSFVKFFSQFNNIMAFLGKHSNEMNALHPVKTYCLPSLLFGCEIWNLTAHSIHRLNVAWDNCFRFIFRGFWRECVTVTSNQLYYCFSLPVSYIIDQRRILFWKRMSCSDNLHSLQKKTPTRIFFHISMNYLWI